MWGVKKRNEETLLDTRIPNEKNKPLTDNIESHLEGNWRAGGLAAGIGGILVIAIEATGPPFVFQGLEFSGVAKLQNALGELIPSRGSWKKKEVACL